MNALVSSWANAMRLLSSLLRGWLTGSVVLGVAWPVSSGAATLENLYSVTVTPDPDAADQRQAAMQAAMAQLLIRVTGSRNAPLDPALQPIITAPDSFLTSYGTLDRQGRTTVGFGRNQVERVLTELGMPVWGPERPLTLLWVAIDDGAGGRALLGANEAELGTAPTSQMAQLLSTVRAEIVAAASERGLPIAWPLLDLENLNAVEFIDVWGKFEERIVAASARYRADAVLIGSVRPGLFGNEVEWLLVDGVERRTLPTAAVRDGLDVAADRYAAEQSTVGGASVAVLTVRDVLTAADYGRVMSYLERQSVLQTVDVESYGNGTLSVRVAARGDARVLERVLTLGGVLRPSSTFGSLGSLTFELAGDGAPP